MVMSLGIIVQGYHDQATFLTSNEDMTLNVNNFAGLVLQKLHINN
jgi:hypothetical protein